jgi:plastocyanin
VLRRITMSVVLLVAAFGQTSATAAPETRGIDVVNNAFAARAVVANAGDTIRWTFKGNGHRVQAYSGASFDSGILNKNAGETFETTFGGGTVLYRCINHSQLSGPSNDCTDMCGKLTDVPPSDLPQAPTVSSPSHNSTTDNRLVQFTGGVLGNAVKVRMYEGTVELGQAVEVSGGTWQHQWFFENGVHEVRFVAEHSEGYYSPAGPARVVPNPNGPGTITERFLRVTVASSDSQPPSIALDQPRDPYSRSPLIITGRVTDDVAVGTITVIVRDNLGLSVDRRPTVNCHSGCGTPSAAFFASVGLDPGYYVVIVQAKDLTNRPPTEVRRNVIVLV